METVLTDFVTHSFTSTPTHIFTYQSPPLLHAAIQSLSSVLASFSHVLRLGTPEVAEAIAAQFKYGFVQYLQSKYASGGVIDVPSELNVYVPLFTAQIHAEVQSLSATAAPVTSINTSSSHSATSIREKVRFVQIRDLKPDMSGLRMRVCVLEVLTPVKAHQAPSTPKASPTGRFLRYLVGDSTGTCTLLVPEPAGVPRSDSAGSHMSSTASVSSMSSLTSGPRLFNGASSANTNPNAPCVGDVVELFHGSTLLHVSTTSKRTHLQLLLPSVSSLTLDHFYTAQHGFDLVLDICTIPVAIQHNSVHILLVQRKETPAFRVFSSIDAPLPSDVEPLLADLSDDELAKIAKKHESCRELIAREMDVRRSQGRRIVNDYWHLPTGSLEYDVSQGRMESFDECAQRVHVEKTGIDERSRASIRYRSDFYEALGPRSSRDKWAGSAQSVQHKHTRTYSTSTTTSTSGSINAGVNTSGSTTTLGVPHGSVSGNSSWGGSSNSGGSTYAESDVRVRDWYVVAWHGDGPTLRLGEMPRRDTGYVRWFPLFEAHSLLARHYPSQAASIERVLAAGLLHSLRS